MFVRFSWVLGNTFKRFLGVLVGFGRFLAVFVGAWRDMLGHVCEAFEGISKGLEIVAGKAFTG